MHEPPLLSKCKLDPVYIPELPVPELFRRLIVVPMASSMLASSILLLVLVVAVEVATEAFESAFLAYYLLKISFANMPPPDDLQHHNENTTQKRSSTYSMCAQTTGNIYKSVVA